MKNKDIIINEKIIKKYEKNLMIQEFSENTINQYTTAIKMLSFYLDGRHISKKILIEWKEHSLLSYEKTTINCKIAAINNFLDYVNLPEFKLKSFRAQKKMFLDEKKELTKSDYIKLVEEAERKKDTRLSLILQTLASTGIRISELKYITIKAIRYGKVDVFCKGKVRVVFLNKKLCKKLLMYAGGLKNKNQSIFVTKNGKNIDRSNIWREMKKLCEKAKVDAEKVFPHAFRHLFAIVFYNIKKDIAKLADVLGHSSINTTRIYIMECGKNHRKQVEKMDMILT